MPPTAYSGIWRLLSEQVRIQVSVTAVPCTLGLNTKRQEATAENDKLSILGFILRSYSLLIKPWMVWLHHTLSTSYTPLRSLRMAVQSLLSVPQSRLKRRGDRAFDVVAPKLWNELPLHVRPSPSLPIFKSCLKTHLFRSVLNTKFFRVTCASCCCVFYSSFCLFLILLCFMLFYYCV